MMRILAKVAIAFLVLGPVCLHAHPANAQQINLQTQVKGLLPGANGGTGLNTAGLTGCPQVSAGVWSLGSCSSGGASYFTGTPTIAVTGTPANTSQVWVATSTSTAAPRQLTQDDILPGFSITSFNGGSTVEIGATVTNPAFTASYTSTPASANITNTDGIDSPLVLTVPYTSGTVVGSFSKTTQASTGFTLTAVGSTTRTAGQNINWQPRSFGGVGTGGATGATASALNAVLAGATGTLSNAGLSASNVGQTYGPYSPSTQKVYLLLVGCGHTSFKDGETGFAFAFNSPTSFGFTNINGVTVAMCLYESTNVLTGTFQPIVQN